MKLLACLFFVGLVPQAADTLIFTWKRDLGERILRTRHLYVTRTPDVFEGTFYLARSEASPWAHVEHAVYRRTERE